VGSPLFLNLYLCLNCIYSLLKANLKDDQTRYSGPAAGRTKLPARVHLPEWQRDHAKAVNNMSEYIIEANIDDDVDDEDHADPPEAEGGDMQASPPSDPVTEDDHGHDSSTTSGQTPTTGVNLEHRVGRTSMRIPRKDCLYALLI
jgi:hypothetical protein